MLPRNNHGEESDVKNHKLYCPYRPPTLFHTNGAKKRKLYKVKHQNPLPTEVSIKSCKEMARSFDMCYNKRWLIVMKFEDVDVEETHFTQSCTREQPEGVQTPVR